MSPNLSKSKENQASNQNVKTDLKNQVKITKFLKEKNTYSPEMEKDRIKNTTITKENICEIKEENSKTLVDHSIETLKESINEFKRKFSNIPKMDSDTTKIASDNKIAIDIDKSMCKSLVSKQEASDKQ